MPGITIAVTADRIRKLAEDCQSLMAHGERIPKVKVRQVAGLATWMAGVMPQMTAFSTMLWAAANCGSAATVSFDQVKRPLRWLVTLCSQNMVSVERHCRLRPDFFTLITFDGSFTGGGATLQVGLTRLEEASWRPIVSFWHGRWTDDELKLLQVDRNSPSGQARLEAYTLLIALTTWREVLARSQGTVAVLGDALGILYDYEIPSSRRRPQLVGQ